MTFKKFKFCETSRSLYSSPGLLNELEYPTNTRLKIELIGIPDIDDPSRLSIIIKQEGASKAIHLNEYKTKFIFHNNLFILDTGNLSDFQVDLHADFSITVACDSKKEFDLIIYAVGDKNPDSSPVQIEKAHA